MATFTKVGYGQVEPNHLSFQRTGQIYAQLPAKSNINVLENGQFVKYDYLNNEVNYTGAGEWMMVFNEVKLYDDWRESYADYAMKKTSFTEGVMTPRVGKTNIGDIYTTNCIANGTVVKGDILEPNEIGFLAKVSGGIGSAKAMGWQVVRDDATMPDGQPAVKLMRIK